MNEEAEDLVQVLAPPCTGCVTSGLPVNLSEPTSQGWGVKRVQCTQNPFCSYKKLYTLKHPNLFTLQIRHLFSNSNFIY